MSGPRSEASLASFTWMGVLLKKKKKDTIYVGAAVDKQTAALKINVFCPISLLLVFCGKGWLSGWTDFSLFLFLFFLFYFCLACKYAVVLFRRHHPARGLFTSLFVVQRGRSFPCQAALAWGVSAEWGVAGPIYLSPCFSAASCSTSGTPVQVSLVLLLIPLSET